MPLAHYIVIGFATIIQDGVIIDPTSCYRYWHHPQSFFKQLNSTLEHLRCGVRNLAFLKPNDIIFLSNKLFFIMTTLL